MNTRAMQRRRKVAGITLRRTEFFPTTWVGSARYKIFSFRRTRHNGRSCWEARPGFKAGKSSYFGTLHRAVEFHLGGLND